MNHASVQVEHQEAISAAFEEGKREFGSNWQFRLAGGFMHFSQLARVSPSSPEVRGRSQK
jgi:hypothetical protein